MPPSWIEELNPPQREAATHPEGPLLVIAGAGSGKTKTLACRVAWLIESGVSPDRILLLTFTRRAAAEMLGRAGRITGQGTAGRVWGGTFHAVANRLLRQYGRALGLSPEFTVVDQSDAADLMNLIRGDLKLGEGKRRFPKKGTLAALYSRVVNSRTRLPEVTQRHFPWVHDELDGIRKVFEGYTSRKRQQNVLDYDDLLLYWNALLTVPQVGDAVADRFDHILVDEYQDTNVIQAEVLRAMRRRNANLMVVGDDAQSIYSFRAATIRNILDFPQQFPGTRVVRLEQNYRSTQPILTASNALMADAGERYAKNLFSLRGSDQKPLIFTCMDEPEQSETVCKRVLEKLEEGVPLREQAVLFRTGHHSDQLEIELTRRNIPFVKYGGLKFVEAAHVKDMMSLLRLLENPSDELSWFRVLLLLEGIGPAAARKVIQALVAGAPTPEVAEGVPPGLGARGPALVAGAPTPEVAEGVPPGLGARGPALVTGAPAPEVAEGVPPGLGARGPALVTGAPAPEVAEGVPPGLGARGPALVTGAPAPEVAEGVPPGSGARGPALVAASPLRVLFDHPPEVPPAAREEWASLRRAMADCLGVSLPQPGTEPGPEDASSIPSGSGLSPAARIERIRRFYEPVFRRQYDNPVVRLRDLDQLEQIAQGYSSTTQFLTDLTLDPPNSTQDLAGPPLLDEDYLILSTIHSAKGCEWDVVHLIHVADGMIPSDMATGDEAEIEEERRLLYVAMTRARNALMLYFPLRYYHHPRGGSDRHSYGQLTRFIPETALPLYERIGGHQVGATDTLHEVTPGAAALSVDAMLNQLWSE